MKKEREFLKELYQNRIEKIPFIDYFQNDRYLRKILFDRDTTERHHFTEIKILQILNSVNYEIEDFKKLVLSSEKYDIYECAKTFAKNVIYKLDNIKVPKLTKLLLNDFVNEFENSNLIIANVLEFNEYSFKKQYGISFKKAEQNYRELKRHADNYFNDYLKNIDKKQSIKREDVQIRKETSVHNLDYKEIVLRGIAEKAQHLKSYFISQQKLVLREYFVEEDVFYDKCNGVINGLESNIKNQMWRRQNELHMMIERLDATQIQQKESLNNQLKDAIPEKGSINLLHFTNGKLIGNLTYDEIKLLKSSIIESEKIRQRKNEVGQNDMKNNCNESKLTMNEIALLHFYKGLQISRENGDSIAKQYGHNSGEKLFQRFTYYSSLANRKGKPNPLTPKRLKNKIELLEKVIGLLPNEKQKRAIDEVQILKNIFQSEFE